MLLVCYLGAPNCERFQQMILQSHKDTQCCINKAREAHHDQILHQKKNNCIKVKPSPLRAY